MTDFQCCARLVIEQALQEYVDVSLTRGAQFDAPGAKNPAAAQRMNVCTFNHQTKWTMH
jgi:hypothetical protein